MCATSSSGMRMCFAMAIAGVFLAAGAAWAHHDEPTQAKEFTSSLVRAYRVCDLANADALTPGGLPACSPAFPPDLRCNMDGPGSRGRVSIRPEQHDLRINVDIQGVTECEGETLVFSVIPNVSSDNCVDPDTMEPLDADCTVAGPLQIPLGVCVISNGRCMIDTTLETLFPFLDVQEGNGEGFEINDCVVARRTAIPGGVPFLRCGVLVP